MREARRLDRRQRPQWTPTKTVTVLTGIGAVQVDVPRDRDGSFDPKIVRKRQCRLDGIDEIVLSLTARGLTTGEVAAHFDDVYGAQVSKDTISKITDKVIEEMTEWRNRPLDRVYPVVFIDALVVKVRDGQVRNKPFYYLLTRSLDPTGRGRARWVTRWKPALNAFAITFEGRINQPCARSDPPFV